MGITGWLPLIAINSASQVVLDYYCHRFIKIPVPMLWKWTPSNWSSQLVINQLGCVWKCRVPLNVPNGFADHKIPFLNGYISLGRLTQHFQTNPLTSSQIFTNHISMPMFGGQFPWNPPVFMVKSTMWNMASHWSPWVAVGRITEVDGGSGQGNPKALFINFPWKKDIFIHLHLIIYIYTWYHIYIDR